MPNHPECIITGCALNYAGSFVWGDLFVWNDLYIFNGNWDAKGGNPRWLSPREVPEGSKTISVINHRGFFERRGVFVLHKDSCELNHEAKAYLSGAT